MVWGLSPIVGFFTCPILGSMSDGCRSKLGRRRPFIILYSVGILVGLLLTGYGHILSSLMWDESRGMPNPYLILITIIGVILLDLDYLIDVSQVEDHSIGLSTFTVMAGAGGAFGYILGGIPWAELFDSPHDAKSSDRLYNQTKYVYVESEDDYYQTNLAYNHKQILFSFVAVIYVICAIISITSFKEIPLNDPNTCGSALKSKKEASKIKYNRMDENFSSVEEEEEEPVAKTHISLETPNSLVDSCNNSNVDNLTQLEVLKYYLTSIVRMPASLRWLCLTHCFSWMSLLCYSLYFTDFIGEEVFGGVPLGDKTSNQELHRLYDQGVRIGSFFMALYSISCSLYSFFLQFLMNNFSTGT